MGWFGDVKDVMVGGRGYICIFVRKILGEVKKRKALRDKDLARFWGFYSIIPLFWEMREKT